VEFLFKKIFIKPIKEAIISLRLAELSPLDLLTNFVFISPILKLFLYKTKSISDKIIKPSPIFPHFCKIFFAALLEYIL
jgi:hypothetical protein